MIAQNNAIVISKVKLNDNDLVVKCFTEQRGIVSYIVKAAFKSSSKNAVIGYFQVLSQLSLIEDFKPNRNLQYLKEVKSLCVYQALYADIYKSTMVLFLSEVLSACLKEESKNETLFSYLSNSFQFLDHQDDIANFHLMFLLTLTKYLGFYPELKKESFDYFDLESGLFTHINSGVYTISGANAALLKQFLATEFEAYHTIKLSAAKRQSFLNMLLVYFDLHLGNFKKPKSLEVLHQVFH